MIQPSNLKAYGGQLSSLGEQRLSNIAVALDDTSHLIGDFWECGCFKGGTSLWVKGHLMETGDSRTIRLFDTFEGLPYSDAPDKHPIGSMKAAYEGVWPLFKELSDCYIHVGIMPASFAGLEDKVISVAYIDVDQYRCVKEVLEWTYPRVQVGGYIFIDDYADDLCQGARKATNEFMKEHLGGFKEVEETGPCLRFVKV